MLRAVIRSGLRSLPLTSWCVGNRLLPKVALKACGKLSNHKHTVIAKGQCAHGGCLYDMTPKRA